MHLLIDRRVVTLCQFRLYYVVVQAQGMDVDEGLQAKSNKKKEVENSLHLWTRLVE